MTHEKFKEWVKVSVLDLVDMQMRESGDDSLTGWANELADLLRSEAEAEEG